MDYALLTGIEIVISLDWWNLWFYPSRQFWDCGRWKSDSLWNFSIVGCQLSTGMYIVNYEMLFWNLAGSLCQWRICTGFFHVWLLAWMPGCLYPPASQSVSFTCMPTQVSTTWALIGWAWPRHGFPGAQPISAHVVLTCAGGTPFPLYFGGHIEILLFYDIFTSISALLEGFFHWKYVQ